MNFVVRLVRSLNLLMEKLVALILLSQTAYMELQQSVLNATQISSFLKMEVNVVQVLLILHQLAIVELQLQPLIIA